MKNYFSEIYNSASGGYKFFFHIKGLSLVFVLLLSLSIIPFSMNASNDDFIVIVDKSASSQKLKNQLLKTNSENENKEYLQGEVFIKFKQVPKVQDVSTSSVKSNKNTLVVSSLENFEFIGDTKYLKLKDLTTEEAIELYKDNPNVEYIEPNYKYYLNLIPNDPNYSKLWGMKKIQADKAWDLEPGEEVLVAVLDTGIDKNHEDLKNNLWTNPGEIPGNGVDDDGNGYVDDIHGYDFYSNDGNPQDGHSHGTHVSGTIAGLGNNGKGVIGVNPNAKIVSLKIFSDSGRYAGLNNVLKAIKYSIDIGAKISNNSWGGGSPSKTLKNAISNAGKNGQLFIAAAGNDYKNNDVSPKYPSSYNLDNIISVASTTSSDNKSSFSNYGLKSVDLGAPGSSILSTTPNNKYGYKNGTSMATPHVSGVLALMYSKNPNLNISDAKQILLDSTDKIPSMSRKTVSGGRLNAYKSVLNTPSGGGSCTPPPSGDWIVNESCSLNGKKVAPKNVIIQPNAVLTIEDNAVLDIDLVNYRLEVKNGGGVLIKKLGKVF